MPNGSFLKEGGTYIEPDDVGEARARELFQYYRPPHEAKGQAIFLPYADSVLQAHAQLASHRLDVKRSVVGLLDKDSAYFVAEATRTLDLEDLTQSESSDDGIWYGSISMPKKGGLLQWTVKQKPHVEDGQDLPAHFEVLDLKQDPRWKEIQFSGAEPWFRYYCGVPLRTESGINIGALLVLDDQPRDSSIRPVLLKVLATTAHNIMVHMKTVKESHEKQRAIHMNLCMADFINPEHRLRSRRMPPRQVSGPLGRERASQKSPGRTWDRRRTPTCEQAPKTDSTDDGLPLSPNVTPQASPPSTPIADTLAPLPREDSERGRMQQRPPQSEKSSASSLSPRPPGKKNVTEADHQHTFDRAVYLLCESLDFSEIGGGGGVALLETSAMADSAGVSVDRPEDRPGRPRSRSNNAMYTPGGKLACADSSNTAWSAALRERVVLGAASITDGKSAKNFGRADSSWQVTLTPQELHRMCKRYPRGKLYDLPDGLGTSLFDPEGRPIAGRLSARFYDLILLRRQFPDAKQVIFIPMFHASLNRWTSCFAFTNSRYRVFSYDMDYLPMLSFSNAIKAEIVRLSTMFADQQKSDFIGSVSHELRSPLHGILASLEFLQDTQCDEFQKSCLNTLDACAHTLLDTVAMVLDYSKVNTLKRKVSNDSSHSSQHQESITPKAYDDSGSGKPRNDPLFATDQDCDVALITEEVVDGLATGHFAKHRSNLGFDDQNSGLNTRLADANTNPMLRRIMAAVRPEVELVLDIGAPANWTFRTQPGAVRRIVMNLFGNSLKYTKHGYINVTLRTMELPSNVGHRPQAVQFEEKQQANVKITVSDTGQGISPEYLRSKIFTPFAQENAKSAGTGLGLSIVRSIVHSLGGEIDIKSIVNIGTIVTVTLPMKRPRAVASAVTPVGPVTTASTEVTLVSSEPRRQDPSVAALQNLQHSPQAAIYEPTMEHDSFGQTQGVIAIHASLVQYLTGWFGFPVLQTWDFDLPAPLLIVDELHLHTLLARRPGYLDAPSLQSIIILCANPQRQATLAKDIKGGQVELMCKPFGPYKLARAILRALSKTSGPINYLEKRYDLPRTPTIQTPRPESPSRSVNTAGLARTDTSTTMTSNTSYVSTPRITPCSESAPSPLVLDVQCEPPGAVSESGYPFPSSARPIAPRSISTPSVETSQLSERSMHLMPPTSSSLPVSGRSVPLSSTKASPEAGNAAVEAALSRNASSIQQRRKPRVLLVDDNKVNLQLLHTFLGKRGYGPENCAVAADGQEAVDKFRSFVPDLIFMDISMPVMDGFEATREIRKLEAEARDKEAYDADNLSAFEARMCKPSLIVALTGNAQGSDRAEAFESGLDLYMTKPVSFMRVGKLLDQWMEK